METRALPQGPRESTAMRRDPPESLRSLRFILERVLRDAEETNMPIVAALIANALAALPDDE